MAICLKHCQSYSDWCAYCGNPNVIITTTTTTPLKVSKAEASDE